MMFQYFKNFLSERCICTRVGKTYSSNKTIDMGIPQGSVIAPILFSIIIRDLPKVLSYSTHVAQYADYIAILVNTTLGNIIIIIHTYIHTFSIALFPAERAQRACSHTRT